MSEVQFVLLAVFIFLNGIILKDDWERRKIQNKHLIQLLILLPIWGYFYFPRELEFYLPQVYLSGIFLVTGIVMHSKKGFLGAGDVKYIAILLLFLIGISPSLFIGNLGIITCSILLIWIGFIGGQICAIDHLLIPQYFKNIRFTKSSILQKGGVFVIDWIIIGFLLFQATQYFLILYGGAIAYTHTDYFYISILIFFVRPIIREYLFTGKHKNFAIVFIALSILFLIEKNGIFIISESFISYIKNIWIFALIFGTTAALAKSIFQIHDTLLRKYENVYHTKSAPYSIAIFGAFILSFIFQYSLYEWFLI